MESQEPKDIKTGLKGVSFEDLPDILKSPVRDLLRTNTPQTILQDFIKKNFRRIKTVFSSNK